LVVEETQPAKSVAQTSAIPAQSAGHYVQLAAFSVKENAARFMERVRSLTDTDQAPLVVVATGGLYRVQSGPYPDRLGAEQAARKLEAVLGGPAILTSPR